jgi:hypothetical protein
MRGHTHARFHAKRWLMPAILFVGFILIVVWVSYQWRKYRRQVAERQADLDMLPGSSSRHLGDDE